MKMRTHTIANRGFSLIELIVAIGIISTLLGVAIFSFRDWQVKNNVEAQVRKMVNDISEIRVRSMTMKQRNSMVLNATNYAFRSYSTDDLPKCSGAAPGGTAIIGRSTNIGYRLKKNATSYYAGTCANVSGDTLEFDQRGMLVGTTATVFVEYPGTSASLDCVTIHTVRVNAGKTNGATCDDR